MAKTRIPEEIQKEVNKIISTFNEKVYKKKPGVEFYAIYKGDFLYLNRKEGEADGPIARLRFNGQIDNWDFAIFRWSNERYDPNEFLFPGSNHINGSIEGALKAGNEAYPPSWAPSEKNLLDVLKYLSRK